VVENSETGGRNRPKRVVGLLRNRWSDCSETRSKSLGDAADIASVLHSRIDRWTEAAGGRRRRSEQLIAGLIPRAQGVTDPDMARALAERDQAMEERALALAEEAIAASRGWVGPLGRPPDDPIRRERWTREVSTVAAYRDRWDIQGQRPLGPVSEQKNIERTEQRKRALAAADVAKAISAIAAVQPDDLGPEPAAEVQQGIGL
jgi:hypothetical protein